MALNYDLSECFKRQDKAMFLKENGEVCDQTLAIIFATMAIGMPVITSENAGEFLDRCYVLGALKNVFDTPITMEEVELHIGLKTNAEEKTFTKWSKDLLTGLFLERSYDRRRDLFSKQREAVEAFVAEENAKKKTR